MSGFKNRQLLFRLVTIVLWFVLFGLLLQRDLLVKSLDIHEAQVIARGRELSFLGIYFRDKRIGYVRNRLTRPTGQGFKLEQDAFLLLNILNENHPVNMHLAADLSAECILKDFTFELTSPFYKMNARGSVIGSEVAFTLTTGKETIQDRILLDRPPFLSTNQRGYLLTPDLKTGDKIKVPYFDPISLTGKDTVVEYRGIEKVFQQGRIYRLHHFTESVSGMRINSWLDDAGKVIKEESPAGFVFISEPEFKATDIGGSSPELLSAVSVPLVGLMPELQGATSIRYRLALPAETDFALDKDRQTYQDTILTVFLEDMPALDTPVCSGQEDELAATPYVEAKSRPVAELVRSLLAEKMEPLTRVRVLAEWVYRNLEKRPVLGIPDALTTLQTRIGDCNEHAVLFAALARNGGIPARIVAGVTLHEGAFYYHAWNEVCLGDSWLSVDTTLNQIPADLTHIKFVEGEPDEMLKIGALLGQLQIEVADDETR